MIRPRLTPAASKNASLFLVSIVHSAFGEECRRLYSGSELGARRLAAKLARSGGHGWTPRVSGVAS